MRLRDARDDPRMSRPVIGRAVAALLALGLGCGGEPPPVELPPRAIQWVLVSGTLADGQRVISGIVTAIDTTKLAFEAGGTVTSVEAVLGQRVEKGQVLARLDPEPFELVVRDAEAQVAAANARYAEAKVTYDRAIALFEVDVASAAERDRAVAVHDASESQLEAAGARLSLAKRDLRRSVLLSPFDGTISIKDIEPAQEVFGGQVIFEMDSGESGLRVETQVPETVIARVQQGIAVEVSFPAVPERRFAAVVSEVGTRASVGNAFTVKADLSERIAEIRPGMTAEVHFRYRIASGIEGFEGYMIPFSAVVAEPGDAFSVFVYERETSTEHKRPIQTGGLRDNDVAVLSGLEEGDVIATAGVSFLREGQKVSLLGVE